MPCDAISDSDRRWQVADLSSKESPELVDLFESVWPEDPNFHHDVKWAFRDHPGSTPVLVAKASASGKAIAARGSIPWPLEVLGSASPLVVHQFHGTCVHPDFRRLGIFTDLNREFLTRFERDGGDCVFNVSVPESRAGYEQIGWRYLPGLRRLILPARPLQLAGAVLTRRGTMRGLPVSDRDGDTIPSFRDVEELLAARHQLLAGKTSTHYSKAFFEWRFSRQRSGYRFIHRPDVGLIVYRVGDRRGIRDVLVGDIWLRAFSTLSLVRLFALLISRERPGLVSLIATPNHPLYSRLRRVGFVRDPRGDLNLGVRPVTEDGEIFLEPDGWAIMTADLDTF